MYRKVTEMSQQALTRELNKRSLDAFNQALLLDKAPAEQLAVYGYKEPMDVLREAKRINDARIADWQQTNGKLPSGETQEH